MSKAISIPFNTPVVEEDLTTDDYDAMVDDIAVRVVELLIANTNIEATTTTTTTEE
jgi:hypothetical protein